VVPSPFPRNDPHLVGAEPLDGNHFLTVAETFRFHGRVGHEDENEEGVGDCQETAEHEDDLPISVGRSTREEGGYLV
jgi:hypothetical protein